MNPTEIEARLLGAFRASLGIPGLTPEDDLFSRGTNSIAVAKAIMAAAEEGVAVAIAGVYEHRTVRRIAAAAAGMGTPFAGTVEPFPLTPTGRFLMAEGRFAERYNISDLWDFDPEALRPALLSAAIRTVMAALPSLGIRLERTRGGIEQVYQPTMPEEPLEHVDLSHLPPDAFPEAVERATARLQRSLVFEASSPLIRFVVFEPASGPWKLFILAHHLFLDGVGFRHFLHDLGRACEAQRDGRAHVSIGSTDAPDFWLRRLADYANGECLAELPYWRSFPWDAYAAFRLPPEFDARPGDPKPTFADTTARAMHHGTARGREDAEALCRDQCIVRRQLDAARSAAFFGIDTGMQFDAVLYAATGVLRHLTGERDLWLDTFDSLRGPVFPDCDTSRVIGYVNEIVPLPIRVPEGLDTLDAVRDIGRQRRQVPKRGLGFRALRYLNTTPAVAQEAARWPEPRIAVNYIASMQRDYPRRFLDLPAAPEWPGPPMDEQHTPYWLAFSVSCIDGLLTIDTRYAPTVDFRAADTANERVLGALAALCDDPALVGPARVGSAA